MSSSGTPEPSNLAVVTVVSGWLFTMLALLAIILLLWSRQIAEIPISADDYVIFMAFAIATGLVAHTTWAVADEGLGKHTGGTSRKHGHAAIKSLMANEILWALVNTCIRINALLLITKLFGTSKVMKIMSLGLIVVSILHGLAALLDVFLICRPMLAAWDNSVGGHCGNQILSYVLLETIGAILDIVILILPLRLIWRLQMKPIRKLALVIVLSTGALVLIITGLRIQALHLVNSADFTFSGGYLGLLSELGALLGIVCCCVPNLAPLFRRLKEKKSASTVGLHAVDYGSLATALGAQVDTEDVWQGKRAIQALYDWERYHSHTNEPSGSGHKGEYDIQTVNDQTPEPDSPIEARADAVREGSSVHDVNLSHRLKAFRIEGTKDAERSIKAMKEECSRASSGNHRFSNMKDIRKADDRPRVANVPYKTPIDMREEQRAILDADSFRCLRDQNIIGVNEREDFIKARRAVFYNKNYSDVFPK